MSGSARLFPSLIAFLTGILVGSLLLSSLARLPLAPRSQLSDFLGIEKPRVVGFQPFWLLDRADVGYPEITTLAYFSLTLTGDGSVVKLVNPREEEPGWTTLRGEKLGEFLRAAKRRGQVLSLAVHASREASVSALLDNPEEHATRLLADVEPIMEEYGFSDMNLDIESFTDASESAQVRFTRFIRAVKGGMDERALGTLTVELTPASLIKPRVTIPASVGEISDFVVLMAYDFHYIHSFLAGPVAPIGGVGKVREYDVGTTLTELLQAVPAEKVLLGIPLYGYEWETLSSEPGAPTIPGSGSTASNRRVGELLARCSDCMRGFDEGSQQPFIVFPSGDYFHQIYYEDARSVAEKLELVQQHNLGGIALWALGYEGKEILEPVRSYRRSFRWVQ